MLKILSSSVIQLINLSCATSTSLNQLKKIENSENFTMFYLISCLISYLMMNLMLSVLQLLLCKLHNFSQLSQSCHTKTELLINSFENNFFANQHLFFV